MSTFFSYISGILNEKKHKSIAVNIISDHVHILFGMNPNISVSDTVRDIKRATSLLINSEHLCSSKFEWQDGYGAFSYSRSHLDNVYNYVLNQELHHQKKTFREEYLSFLEKFQIEYDERYLFEFFD